MACGNGSDRTQHPVEIFGDDWMEWGLPAVTSQARPDQASRTSGHGAD
jgi:hypothetical protein